MVQSREFLGRHLPRRDSDQLHQMGIFRGPRAFQNLEIHENSHHTTLIFSLLEVLYNLLPHIMIPQKRNFRKIPEAKAVSFELKSTSPHPNPFPSRLNYFDLTGLTPIFIPIDCTLPFDSCTNRLRADGVCCQPPTTEC